MTNRAVRPMAAAVRAALHRPKVARAPLALYGAGLGGVLGRGILRLEHRGRFSGEVRYAVLEVVDRPRPGVIRVVSGLGPDSQWFRNILAEPRVRVSSGWGPPVPATAEVLSEAEAEATFERYRAVHPWRWGVLERTVGEHVPAGSTWAQAIPVVDLVLASAPSRTTDQEDRPPR